jgi:hypothetical protein
LPSSADDIFLISPGFHTGGVLHLVEAPDRDDIGVEVTVGSRKDSELFKRTKLCTLRRGKDGHGVGIFVSISKLLLHSGFRVYMRADRLIRSNVIPEIGIRYFSTSPSHFRRARTSPLFLTSRPGCPSTPMSSQHLRSMRLVPSPFILSTVLSSSRYVSTPYSWYWLWTLKPPLLESRW